MGWTYSTPPEAAGCLIHPLVEETLNLFVSDVTKQLVAEVLVHEQVGQLRERLVVLPEGDDGVLEDVLKRRCTLSQLRPCTPTGFGHQLGHRAVVVGLSEVVERKEAASSRGSRQ